MHCQALSAYRFIRNGLSVLAPRGCTRLIWQLNVLEAGFPTRNHRALIESLLISGLLFSALTCQKSWLVPLACKDTLPNSFDRASADMVRQAIKAAELSYPTLPRRSSTT